MNRYIALMLAAALAINGLIYSSSELALASVIILIYYVTKACEHDKKEWKVIEARRYFENKKLRPKTETLIDVEFIEDDEDEANLIDVEIIPEEEVIELNQLTYISHPDFDKHLDEYLNEFLTENDCLGSDISTPKMDVVTLIKREQPIGEDVLSKQTSVRPRDNTDDEDELVMEEEAHPEGYSLEGALGVELNDPMFNETKISAKSLEKEVEEQLNKLFN
jgi:hypothetical protein